ncbi:calcium/sodium antiporter [Candidatus Woesearchaeota archaeon]|nr:calcium/sodium antiporter [Candidatus Woesearchaeota archaeon]
MVLEAIFSSPFGCLLVFAAALALLIKSSDFFIDNAEKLGAMLGVPPFILGITVVSLGTSLPELATSLIAVFKGETEFVIGNVIGSNIANILLIVGIIAILTKKIKVEWDIIKIDLPLLLGSAILLGTMLMDRQINTIEGIILMLGFLVYIRYAFTARHKGIKIKKTKFKHSVYIYLALAAAGVYFGAEYTIESIIAATKLPFMQSIGIDMSIIALSAVAIGTSLPELTVSLAAARKGNYEVALGNVLGSNIFNTFFVVGIPSLFGVLHVSEITYTLALPVMLGATLLYIISTLDREVSNYEGAMFLLFYAYFIVKLFGIV